MGDYTPTTEEVREYVVNGGEYRPWISPDDVQELALEAQRGEGFDRWLAAHDARIASEAAERAVREFRAGLGRRFWFQDPYGHFDPATVSALHRQVEGMLDAEADRLRAEREDAGKGES